MADAFVLSNDFRGGRCKDVPTFLGANQCAEAMNVDFHYSRCGNKRWGSQLVSANTSVPPWGSLIRHQPGLDESANELWAFNHGSDLPHQALRIVSASFGTLTWVTLVDPILATLFPRECGAVVRGASLNGKLFLAYASPVDRLHVWDPATGTVRRVGIPTPAAPTLNSRPAGAVPTCIRVYRVAWTKQTTGITTYRSGLSLASIGVTLSSQYAVMNRPALANEGETHWELYAYQNDDDYATGYLVATTPIATLTANDNTTPLEGEPPPEIGLSDPPASWKYIMVHGNRLLGAGAWNEGVGRNNRVWYTAPLGSGDAPGDDERVPATLAVQNYLDIDENDGGFIVGFGGVINGSPIVFKSNGVHRMIPTGNASNPYQVAATPISKSVGAIRQEAIVMAEDENGNPAVYWLARNGPHRYSPTKGVEYCGYDVEDLWQTTVAGDTYGQPHGIWYPNKKQIWWYLADGTGPLARCANFRLVLHTEHCRSTGQGARGGWVVHDGAVQVALASVGYVTSITAATGRENATPKAVLVGAPLRPYVSLGNYRPTPPAGPIAATLVLCDVYNVLSDLGVYYSSYIYSPAYMLGGLANRFTSMQPLFLARYVTPGPVFSACVFGAALTRDFNEEVLADLVTAPPDVTVPPDILSLKYQVRRMAIAVTGAHVAQLVYGDTGVRAAGPWNMWWGIEAVMLERETPNERA